MMIGNLFARDNAVSFGAKLAASEAFDALFREGMALVEETAAYLDGDGRAEACHLPRVAALAYASESMRLTTRLMQIASWLLLQRAVNEGEMSQREAASDKNRSRAAWTGQIDGDKVAHPAARLVRAHRQIAGPAGPRAAARRAVVRAVSCRRDGTAGRKPTGPAADRLPRLGAGARLDGVAGQRLAQAPDRARDLVGVGDHVLEGALDPVAIGIGDGERRQ